MKIAYEEATIKDAHDISYIGAYSWKETYLELVPKVYLENKLNNYANKIEKQKKIIQDKNNTIYIAKVDDKTVGFVSFGKSENEKYKEYGYVGALYLLKDYQKYGIGKHLFKIALESLKEQGYTKMMLECMSGNKTLDFYKKYLGEIIDTTNYPLNNGNIIVKADIILFDIDNTLNEINKINKIKTK